jgi:hypothetical protein
MSAEPQRSGLKARCHLRRGGIRRAYRTGRGGAAFAPACESRTLKVLAVHPGWCSGAALRARSHAHALRAPAFSTLGSRRAVCQRGWRTPRHGEASRPGRPWREGCTTLGALCSLRSLNRLLAGATACLQGGATACGGGATPQGRRFNGAYMGSLRWAALRAMPFRSTAERRRLRVHFCSRRVRPLCCGGGGGRQSFRTAVSWQQQSLLHTLRERSSRACQVVPCGQPVPSSRYGLQSLPTGRDALGA